MPIKVTEVIPPVEAVCSIEGLTPRQLRLIITALSITYGHEANALGYTIQLAREQKGK